MKKIRLLLMFLISIYSIFAFATHWDYGGNSGPEHWGDLSAEFNECKLGKEQSPIDISTRAVEKAKLDQLGLLIMHQLERL